MKITRESKIGLVALVAIVLSIWGINYLKGINILQPTDKYYAVYGNVKGLIESAVVYLNGYKVGNVTAIEFDDKDMGRIIVEISLEKKVKLPKNTRMVVRSGSLISGAKDIDLELGGGPGYQQPGDTLQGSIQVELTDYIDPIRKQVESLVTSMDTLMLSLSDLVDRETRKNLQGTIANLNSISQSLSRSLQSSGSLNTSFSNLSEITGNLKKSNDAISALLHNLAAVSDTLKQADLKALVDNAGKTFAQTAAVFEKINEGQGTAGQLVVNDSLYRNLNSAIASLDSLLVDLKAHPKRYVHVSVFGKRDK